jgi:hypothetical protein
MRPRGEEPEPEPARGGVSRTPQRAQRVAGLRDRVAGIGGQLDHRGEELGLDPAVVDLAGLLDHVLRSGHELEGLRVQEHDLLLDADRPRAPAPEGLLDHFPRTPWTGRPEASQR